MRVTDWGRYHPEFQESEFRCSHTGLCDMQVEFMDVLHAIRIEFDKPMVISSGYRHPTHPIEARKNTTGEHTMGTCADVKIRGPEALDLIAIALRHGITRFGIQQKGDVRFLHLGIGGGSLPNPALWSY